MKNGNSTEYQLIEDGNKLPIAYHVETPIGVINALESARVRGQRVKLFLGDRSTGKPWNETNDITGTIGLSKGTDARYPILLSNVRSIGGGTILDHCIIKIKVGNYTVYQSANYQEPKSEIKYDSSLSSPYELRVNGELFSRHTSERSAKMLQSKLY